MKRFAQRIGISLWGLLISWSVFSQSNSGNYVLEQAETFRKAGQYKSADSLLSAHIPEQIDSLYWAIQLSRIHLYIDQKDSIAYQRVVQILETRFPTQDFPLLHAQWLNLQGIRYEEQGDYELARQVYMDCLKKRQSVVGINHPLIANTYNNLGNLFYRVGQYDQAIQMQQEALRIRTMLLSPPHLDLASSYNNLAACYYSVGIFTKAQDYHNKALSIRRSLLENNHPLVAASLNNLGNCWLALQQPEKALTAHQEALSIREQKALDVPAAQSHNNLGNTYAALNQSKPALFHYKKALTLRSSAYGQQSIPVAQAQANLGNFLLQIGDNGPAQNMLENALRTLEIIGVQGVFLADVQMNLARSLFYAGSLLQAQTQLEAAQSTYLNTLGSAHPKSIESYTLSGNISANQNDWEKALKQYQNVDLGLQKSSRDATLTSIRNRSNVCLALINLKQLDEAFTMLKETIALCTKEGYEQYPIYVTLQTTFLKAWIDSGKFDQGLSYLKQHNLSKTWANTAAIPYIGWLLEAGRLFAAAKQYPKALTKLNQGVLILEKQIDQFHSQESQRQLAEWQFILFEEALQVCWESQQIKSTSGYADSAFHWNERYRNLLFRNQPSTSKKQDSLSTEQISEAKQSNLSKPNTLKDIQKTLISNQQGMISYFFGARKQYWIYVDGEQVVFDTLTNQTNYVGSIIRLRDGINNFVRSQQEEYYLLYAQNYATSATTLYQDLLAKPKEKLGHLPTRLIILPDGPLYFIPFDLLLVEPIDSLNILAFHRYPFAVHTHSFSYQQSAQIWLNHRRKHPPKRGLWLGMAPMFTGQEPGLPPLKHNQKEIQYIRSKLGHTKTIIGHHATRSTFEKLAPHAKVLHLATHGQADPNEGESSFLAFSKTRDSIQQKLYARDLKNINIMADLVVLSACQTGLGSYQRGEGLVSLTRAFLDAGAASTLTTLWSIDDEKSSVLMDIFYANLLNGLPKDLALQKARITFLNTYRSEYAHPFFWAAYTPHGNMQPLKLTAKWVVYAPFGSLLLLILIAASWIWIKKRNIRS